MYSYEIHASGTGSDGIASGESYFRRFKVLSPGGQSFIKFSLPLLDAYTLDLDEAQVQSVLAKIGVRRLEAELAIGEHEGWSAAQNVRLTADDDGDELKDAAGSKCCRYQRGLNRSLYCTASSADDEFAVGSEGLTHLAPTTTALCSSCNMPPEELVCDSLVHVTVKGRAVISPQRGSRSISSAMCESGEGGVRADVSKCHIGGHSCAHRTVVPERRVSPQLHPLQLHEAIDFMDATWRLRFGAPLLAPTATAVAGGLGLPVATRDELVSRIGDLVTILEFRVSDDLLPPSPTRVSGGISRAESAMRNAGVDVPEDAIRALRDIVDIKNSLRHQGKAKDLGKHLDRLGIRRFGLSPAETWTSIASTGVAAFTSIRNAVRESATG